MSLDVTLILVVILLTLRLALSVNKDNDIVMEYCLLTKLSVSSFRFIVSERVYLPVYLRLHFVTQELEPPPLAAIV